MRYRLSVGGGTNLKGVDPNWVGNILELRSAEIADGQIEPCFHLPIGVLRKTDRAGFCDPFQSRGDVDTIAHEIAVAFLDNVAEMYADAKLDTPLGRQAPLRSTIPF